MENDETNEFIEQEKAKIIETNNILYDNITSIKNKATSIEIHFEIPDVTTNYNNKMMEVIKFFKRNTKDFNSDNQLYSLIKDEITAKLLSCINYLNLIESIVLDIEDNYKNLKRKYKLKDVERDAYTIAEALVFYIEKNNEIYEYDFIKDLPNLIIRKFNSPGLNDKYKEKLFNECYIKQLNEIGYQKEIETIQNKVLKK